MRVAKFENKHNNKESCKCLGRLRGQSINRRLFHFFHKIRNERKRV